MSEGMRIVEEAKQHIGKPYVFGAAGPNKFDCSGLVLYCHNKIGVNGVPRVSKDQAKGGVEGNGSPGDCVFFGENKVVSHVGICIGGGDFIHAPDENQTVKISSYTKQKYFIDRFICFRRYWEGVSSGSGSGRWLPEVNGFNPGDANNGYAGIIGRNVVAVRVGGGTPYRVHVLGGGWLPPVTGNNQGDGNNGYAGNMRTIDGLAIQGATYAVHINGRGWLPQVNGYNINDGNNGYAGILGKSIDAIMVNGRSYAVAC